nr:hypothetical protein [Mycobacteroides abscessus]
MVSIDLAVSDNPWINYISKSKVAQLYSNTGQSRISHSRSVSGEISGGIPAVFDGKLSISRETAEALSIYHQAHDWTRSSFGNEQIKWIADAAPGDYVAVRMPLYCGTLFNGNEKYPDTVWWRGHYGGYGVVLAGHKSNLVNDTAERIEYATWMPSQEGAFRPIVQAMVQDSIHDRADRLDGPSLTDLDPDWATNFQILMEVADNKGVDRGEYLWRQWADMVFRCDDIAKDYLGYPLLAGSPVWIKKLPGYFYGWYQVTPKSSPSLDPVVSPSYCAEWSGQGWTGMIGGVSSYTRQPDSDAFPDIPSLPATPEKTYPETSTWVSTAVIERREDKQRAAEDRYRKRHSLPSREPVFIPFESGSSVKKTLWRIPRRTQ